MQNAEARLETVRPGRYAAIDIGTVTCRMLVADVDASGRLHELDHEYAIANLGEGVDATGMLNPEAIARVADIIEGYCAVRDSFATPEAPVTTIAVATSASRDARNACDFVAALERLGVRLTVVAGEREAALSFLGASCDFADEGLAVVDIGGGSTEVVFGRGGAEPAWSHSFDIGCRRVTEKFIHSDPPSKADLDTARAWIRQGFMDVLSSAPGAGRGVGRVVAVAGTATTVVAVRDALEVYDSSRVHKQCVTREDLDGVFGMLATVDVDARGRVAGLDPGRAPVIVAGLVVMQTLMDVMGAESFTVSESDILQGIILDASRE